LCPDSSGKGQEQAKDTRNLSLVNVKLAVLKDRQTIPVWESDPLDDKENP
jgi:hypothetical protein